MMTLKPMSVAVLFLLLFVSPTEGITPQALRSGLSKNRKTTGAAGSAALAASAAGDAAFAPSSEHDESLKAMTISDSYIVGSILSMAGGIVAASTVVLVSSTMPNAVGPSKKSLASAAAVLAIMEGLDRIGRWTTNRSKDAGEATVSTAAKSFNSSDRYAIMSLVAQGLGMCAAAAVAFSVLWCFDTTSSTRIMEFGAVVGACVYSLMRFRIGPYHAVQLVVPYTIALLAVHAEPFLTFKHTVASEFGRVAITARKTMSIVDLTSRWTLITAALTLLPLGGMHILERNGAMAKVSGQHHHQNTMLSPHANVLPLLARISMSINLVWTVATVSVWQFKEMPYFGLGAVSVAVSVMHYFAMFTLDDNNTEASTPPPAITATTTDPSFRSNSGGRSLTDAYDFLHRWIFVLGIFRLVYWELADEVDYPTTLGKHFYSLVVTFVSYGYSASYKRDAIATIAAIVSTFVVLMRLIVVYLFAEGANNMVVAGSLGLIAGLLLIIGVLAGLL